MNLKERIKSLASNIFQEVNSIRKYLHQYPELSFEEYKTSEFVQSKLSEWGVEYTKDWVKTGIVATIKGNNPDKKVIAFRADLDALPIHEVNEVDYKSKNIGVMHACGHDVHTSCLLGGLKILNELKDQFEGTVKFIFQPGEEKLPGGASLMIKEGVLENPKVDQITALHVFPELEAGKVGFKSGMYMASCDEIHVKIIGKGGHGAMPHKNIDPVSIGAQLIVALQQVVSRYVDPSVPTVLSFGKFIANGATNVIPDEVNIEGTFRTMNEFWREEAHKRMIELANSLVEGMGAKVDFKIDKGYPYLENDTEFTSLNKNWSIDYLGSNNVVDLPIRMTAEDFSYYSQQAVSCFYRLGVRNEAKGIVHPVHSSKFDVDEKSLEIGAGLTAWLAIKQLES